MLSKYATDNGNHIIFNGHHMEIYIPEVYFNSKLSVSQGNTIETFGLLPYSIFDAKDKEIDNGILNLPTMIILTPTELNEVKKHIKNDPDTEPKKYTACRFYKGDKITPSNIRVDSSNVEMFINTIFNNKIGGYIPYNKLLDIWEKNLETNNIKLGVSASNLEIIIAEICRDKNNLNQTFAKVIGKNPSVSQYMYKTANMREICSRNSTFAALTFEDMDAMITTSLNIKNYNKKQVESPIEKIIKMWGVFRTIL